MRLRPSSRCCPNLTWVFSAILSVICDTETALASFWTLLATGFGLSLTVLITAIQERLPLPQAIVATELIFLAHSTQDVILMRHVHSVPAGQRRSSLRRSNLAVAGAILNGIFSIVIILFIWIKAPTLDGAEDATLVVFFASVSALPTGRKIAFVFMAMSATTLLPANAMIFPDLRFHLPKI